MERLSYFIRRLLLVIPTFLGIAFLVFALTQFVPGGPVEQRIAQLRGMGSGESGQGTNGSVSITEDQRKAIEREFGFDDFLVRYTNWLFRDAMGMNTYPTSLTTRRCGSSSPSAFPSRLPSVSPDSSSPT